MSHLMHERPYANELMGAQSTGPVTGGADWICRQPDHWLFEGYRYGQGGGHPRIGGMGVAWRSSPHSGFENRGLWPHTRGPGSTQWRRIHGNSLSWTPREPGIQRGYHLVG